jgi:spore germination cell wall hydrolase CwlJ-like protein
MTDPITASILCITATIWLEARGEPDFDAMAAVADTIMVRAAQRDMAPCDVVREPGQYATGPVDLEYMAPADLEAYERARSAAVTALWGQGLGIQADHFHSTAVRPYWARGRAPVGRVGDHVFYWIGE